ncbi:unnamed protein product [Haemonchus placei]|uniref:TCB2 n=1 Tax=Haemonchus placei TaxID=6290 RepID=A0A0N4WYJ6_HAEPC|nr:unnamed protein product [Haemonchus placei]
MVFIDNDIKIKTVIVLKNVLLPWAKYRFRFRPFVFQQDSAPAHRARLSGFINAQECSSNSLDLNPMNYSVWSLLESKACSKQHHSIDSLKRNLLRVWEEIPLKYLRAKVDAFPVRLRAVPEHVEGVSRFTLSMCNGSI